MLVLKTKDYDSLSRMGATVIAERLHEKPDLVMGLATGGTPVGVYRELVRMHKEEGLDFSKVITFNLDEYLDLPPFHPQSYHYFMQENIFKHINISPQNIYIPLGISKNLKSFCEWYEKKIIDVGGIDIQILGIGSNGHIAFNEPGSSFGSRTRIKRLREQTIEDNKRFFKEGEEVPNYALTMGIGTVMEAGEIMILASGSRKAEIVARAIEGPLTIQIPASILQMHPRGILVVDEEAGALLTGEYDTNYHRWEMV